MAVHIKIADTAFNAGQPFEGVPKTRAVVTICSNQSWEMNMISANQIFHSKSRATNEWEVSADLIIDINGYTLPNNESWDLMPKLSYKAQIADYVAKGILSVKKDGATQTVAMILTPSAAYPY